MSRWVGAETPACTWKVLVAGDATEQAAEGGPVTGLGRELEKLAIDGMALAALDRIRTRAVETGADKLTSAQVTASVNAARCTRA